MITEVRVQGYRVFRTFEFRPHSRFNIIVGANESGKSTLIEAMMLALTGRINGRWIGDEIHPYLFNAGMVEAFVTQRSAGKRVPWPEIHIEVYFEDRDELQRLSGANNSALPTRACPGITMRIFPDLQYENELEAWGAHVSAVLPVEYYTIDWRTFAGDTLSRRPRELATALIDSRTVRSFAGLDFHTRQLLMDYLEPAEQAAISLAHRTSKEELSKQAFADANSRIAKLHAALHDRPISLAMDQSPRTSWENAVVPHVAEIPFTMSGQGQQAAVKISLAMVQHYERSTFVMVEEPENHLTHTSLTKLLSRIERLAAKHQQLFISTHSSFVLNRLGLDSLHLISNSRAASITGLTPDTVKYFQKLPGYDTLRMALATKLVLVEGPSDEIVFERIFNDRFGQTPMALGIDVVSIGGLSFARCLELCSVLDKTVAIVRDNDDKDPKAIQEQLATWLSPQKRRLFIGSPGHGNTLESQLRYYNDPEELRDILGISAGVVLEKWMAREKTETALRIASSENRIVPPKYMLDAAEFIHG